MSEILHYGIPRRSGRYPWGSGEDPYQRNKSFLAYVDDLHKKGVSEVDIAKGLGISTSELRRRKSLAKNEQRKSDTAEALRLKNKGYSNVAIGQRLNMNESSVRALLNPALEQRNEITESTAKVLKNSVEKKDYIDIGVGVERHLGISRTKLMTAVQKLKDEGYTVHYVQVDQLGTGKKTSVMVLAKPGTSYSDVYKNKDKIRMVTDYSEDGGRSYLGLEPIRSVNGNRVLIKYAEDGGTNKDGVIELRRGVEDISLGNAKYAQVRIGVDGKYYMKGMAIYSDDMPDGVDIIYNSNKHRGTPIEKVYKQMKDDPDNPFGSTVRQRHYINKNGESELSALNIVNEEGDWTNWSKNISSQVLSKQSPNLAKKQLGLAYDLKKEEYDEIMSLTNPVIKKKMLLDFADGCDAAAVDLKAAALPRQSSHIILPIQTIKENEIYAPNYRDGETVVLIRHPHGGTFEIPELKVNNKNREANKIMKNAKDAVGINPKTAQILSGADFDGDTVIVIPNNNKYIKNSSPLKGLQNFDPKEAYPAYDGMKRMSPRTKQLEMGKISNLITDMTIRGASQDEICRAVRHSMVVIDAEKHNLNYKQSYYDNGIGELKKKYQGSDKAGASTLISRASSEKRIGTRKESIDPKTGKKIYTYTNETFVKDGKTYPRTISSTKMAEAEDAYSLSSGTIMENTYAAHANKLKALANMSRKNALATKPIPYSPSAKKTYSAEVASLNAKLNIAYKNKPLERQAQIIANSVVNAKRKSNPGMDNDTLKKIKTQALTEARLRVGAKKQQIKITPKEWEAIQAGAISTNVLTQIINNSDSDHLKQLATPRTVKEMTAAKVAKAKNMLKSGYTQAEIADSLGVSVSTIRNSL